MMPTMTGGSLHSHASQLYVAHSECTFDTIPMNATGIAHTMIKPMVTAHEIAVRMRAS